LRHLASVSTLAGALLLPSLAFAQGGDQPQPQPQPDPAPQPEPKPEPKAEPAPTVTNESGPTVTLGTTPSKDATEKKEEKAEAKEESTSLPWAGTALTAQTSMSTTTFARSQQLTPTDLVESWFLFTPRWTINKSFTVRGRFTLTYEWTDTAASSTTTRNEPQFGDSIVYLDYTKIPEIPKLGIKTKITGTVGFPTSKASLERSQIFSPGIGASFGKTFEKVGKGMIALGAGATWSHPVYGSTTPGMNNPRPYSPSCFSNPGGDSSSCASQIAGSGNPENIIAALFTAGGEWPLGKGTFKPSTFMFFINTWDYHFKDLPGLTDNGHATVNCVGGNCNAPVFKQATFFGAAIDYDFWGPMKWLGAEVGYYMFRGLIDGNGHIGNPFFDTMQDMRVYVAANIAFDDLYLTIAGKKTKEETPSGAKGKGVVRSVPTFSPLR
jgi:hypothetical protein